MYFRFSFIYFCLFAFIGLHMPFWPVWLKSKDISILEISILTAITFALKIIVTPYVSKITDKNNSPRLSIILSCLGLFIFLFLFIITNSFYSILLVTLVAFSFWSPIMALIDGYTINTIKDSKYDYGKIRIWGSIANMIVAITSGKLIGTFGASKLLYFLIVISGLLLIASFILPKKKEEAYTQKNIKISFRPFLKSRWFIIFLISTTLIQGSHAFYYTFGSINWQKTGVSDEVIGFLWGISVASEIIFFLFGKKFISKIGFINIIILGGIAATCRWFAIGYFSNIFILMFFQLLQAISFAASHVAAISLIGEKVSKEISSTGQGLYSSFIMGIGMGCFVFLSGPIYQNFGSFSFYLMAGVSFLGIIMALLLKRTKLDKIDLSSNIN
ncbi:MFS transporter [Apibacter sp. B2966]|nr:MFS transporter [Apibacter sp. B2966]